MSEIVLKDMAVEDVEVLKQYLVDYKLYIALGDFPELDAKASFCIKPNFNTACWTKTQEVHRIYLGDSSLTPCVSEELKPVKARKLLNHEMAHAIYTNQGLVETDTTLKEFSAELTKQGIPFMLYNLFEDAFIEETWRRAGFECFEWSIVEPFPDVQGLSKTKGFKVGVDYNPVFAFFMCIWLENHSPAENSVLQSLISADALNFMEHIYTQYYLPCIELKTSKDKIDLMVKFIQEFGAPPQAEQKQGCGMMAGLSENFDEDVIDPDYVPEPEDSTLGTVELTSHEPNGQKHFFATYYTGQSTPWDRVNVLVKKLQKVLKGTTSTKFSHSPSKRVSLKQYFRGLAPFSHTVNEGQHGSRNVVLVIDCSGSMWGRPFAEGLVLFEAFNKLARTHQMEVTVLLSGVFEDGKAAWTKFKLPTPAGYFEKLIAQGGAEGLNNTMMSNLDTLKEADALIVYTDGNIYDDPVNKKELHKYGIYSIGAYVGKVSDTSELGTYFDKVIVRDTIEALVDSLVLHRL